MGKLADYVKHGPGVAFMLQPVNTSDKWSTELMAHGEVIRECVLMSSEGHGSDIWNTVI